jgi:hypothetical protein
MLAMMLLADAVFVQLHRLHLQGVLDARFSLELERSIPEYYQHAKELLAAMLMFGMFLRYGDAQALCWAGLFGYLFADDAFQIHERVGSALATAGVHLPVPGLEAEFAAELAVSAGVGLILLAALAYAWRHGSQTGRRVTLRLLVALAGLAAFGVGIDALHSMIVHDPWRYRLGIVEDGGELLSMTVLLWLAFVHTVEGRAASPRPPGSARRAGRTARAPFGGHGRRVPG